MAIDTTHPIDQALELAPEMAEMLRRLEWGGTTDSSEGGYVAACPACDRCHPDEAYEPVEEYRGHAEGCELAAMLARANRIFPPESAS